MKKIYKMIIQTIDESVPFYVFTVFSVSLSLFFINIILILLTITTDIINLNIITLVFILLCITFFNIVVVVSIYDWRKIRKHIIEEYMKGDSNDK